jgi:hypothetical protein
VIGREWRKNVYDWIKNCSVETIHWDLGFYMLFLWKLIGKHCDCPEGAVSWKRFGIPCGDAHY